MKKLVIGAVLAISMVSTAFAGAYESVDPTDAEATVWYRVSRDNQIAFLTELTQEFNRTNPYGITVTAVSAGGYGDIFTKFINLIGTDE